jgi:CRISPR/Cas system-associated exonuclease Cas4 (RecB family)
MALGGLAKMINKATKQMTPAEKFLYELNQTIVRGNEKRTPSKSFKPSSLGKCLRLNYFQIIGAEIDGKTDNSEGIGITESGTDRHERLQKWVARMREIGYNCDYLDVEQFLKVHPVAGTRVVSKHGMETKCFNDTFNISFLCDGIIKFDDVYYILEIKTEASFKWQGQVQPFEDHIVQATTYSVCLGINKILFLYEERDLCRKKSFIVEVSDDMKESLVIGRIETVNNHIALNTVPPRTDNQKDCTYCDYKKECGKWGE